MRAVAIAFLFALTTTQSFAQEEVTVGYLPIMPMAPLFVIAEDGFPHDGFEPVLKEYPNGPAMVDDLVNGDLDAAYIGIGPAMVAHSKGAKIKVVAAGVANMLKFVALGDLAAYFETGDPNTAFKRFAEGEGRKATIATLPPGSVPHVVFVHWLTEKLNSSTDDVEIVSENAAETHEKLVNGEIDGSAIFEPIPTIVTEEVDGAVIVASGSELLDGQPGVVVVASEAMIEDHPDFVAALVGAHRETGNALNADHSAHVEKVRKYVHGGTMPSESVAKGLDALAGGFVSDPHMIKEATRIMHDLHVDLGHIEQEVDLDDLFDTSHHDKIAQ